MVLQQKDVGTEGGEVLLMDQKVHLRDDATQLRPGGSDTVTTDKKSLEKRA